VHVCLVGVVSKYHLSWQCRSKTMKDCVDFCWFLVSEASFRSLCVYIRRIVISMDFIDYWVDIHGSHFLSND
jgi:hypothetical protein